MFVHHLWVDFRWRHFPNPVSNFDLDTSLHASSMHAAAYKEFHNVCTPLLVFLGFFFFSVAAVAVAVAFVVAFAVVAVVAFVAVPSPRHSRFHAVAVAALSAEVQFYY